MDYCITHGRHHYHGETDTVAKVGDDIECREEDQPIVTGEVPIVGTEVTVEDDSFVIRAGILGYLDTIRSGLVPVKVLAIHEDRWTAEEGWRPTEVEVKVTAARPGYDRGETLFMHAPNVTLVSRDQVFTRRGQYRIMGPTRFRTDEGRLL